MPGAPRVHLQDAIYYVTLDGPQGEPIFKDEPIIRNTSNSFKNTNPNLNLVYFHTCFCRNGLNQ